MQKPCKNVVKAYHSWPRCTQRSQGTVLWCHLLVPRRGRRRALVGPWRSSWANWSSCGPGPTNRI